MWLVVGDITQMLSQYLITGTVNTPLMKQIILEKNHPMLQIFMQRNTSAFTPTCAIKQSKFHISSMFISEVILLGYVMYSPTLVE